MRVRPRGSVGQHKQYGPRETHCSFGWRRLYIVPAGGAHSGVFEDVALLVPEELYSRIQIAHPK